MQGYKRYRVSSQRFSKKPMNVEFVLVVDTHRKSDVSADQLAADDRTARSGRARCPSRMSPAGWATVGLVLTNVRGS